MAEVTPTPDTPSTIYSSTAEAPAASSLGPATGCTENPLEGR